MHSRLFRYLVALSIGVSPTLLTTMARADVARQPMLPRTVALTLDSVAPYRQTKDYRNLLTDLLFQSVMSGDQTQAARLLNEGAGVTTGSPDSPRFKTSALLVAVVNQDPEMVRLLLEHGADPDLDVLEYNDAYKTRYTTILHYAAHLGSLEIVKLLLERGANPNRNVYVTSEDTQAELKGSTKPLIIAKAKGHEPIADYLAKHGADKRDADRLHAWFPGTFWADESLTTVFTKNQNLLVSLLIGQQLIDDWKLVIAEKQQLDEARKMADQQEAERKAQEERRRQEELARRAAEEAMRQAEEAARRAEAERQALEQKLHVEEEARKAAEAAREATLEADFAASRSRELGQYVQAALKGDGGAIATHFQSLQKLDASNPDLFVRLGGFGPILDAPAIEAASGSLTGKFVTVKVKLTAKEGAGFVGILSGQALAGPWSLGATGDHPIFVTGLRKAAPGQQLFFLGRVVGIHRMAKPQAEVPALRFVANLPD